MVKLAKNIPQLKFGKILQRESPVGTFVVQVRSKLVVLADIIVLNFANMFTNGNFSRP